MEKRFKLQSNYARKTDSRTGPARQASGQICIDSSRRICARRDAPHSRRQTRCALFKAGHRYWPFESSQSRRAAATASERKDFGENAPQRCQRLSQRSTASAYFAPSFGSPFESFATRRACRGFSSRAFAASTLRSKKAQSCQQEHGGLESRAHAREAAEAPGSLTSPTGQTSQTVNRWLKFYRYFLNSGCNSLTVFAGQSFLSVMMASLRA